jgi:hypothetical protein
MLITGLNLHGPRCIFQILVTVAETNPRVQLSALPDLTGVIHLKEINPKKMSFIMKQLITLFTLFATLMMSHATLQAQDNRDLQYYRAPDQTGLNVFETSKTTDVEFDGLQVRIGGANTLQFQGISHENSGAEILDIGPNFNLATSNLDLDVQLHNGLRMHLRTYLSSRHHSEAWVKGGYMQIDRLDFLSDGFASDIMDHVTVKVGHMQINYGDNHFRRSDNGQAIYNPFVGNYIMDSFATEVAGEFYFQKDGWLAMVGVTNGKLNQSVVDTDIMTRPSFLGKLGFDRQIDSDLRVRLTGSLYHTGQSASNTLYTGDRAGARYYNVLTNSTSDFRTGRWNPGFNNEVTAFMVNPFVKFQGLEFYGVFERASGKAAAEPDTRTFNQYGAELLYRFGQNENIYLGGRYNLVTGEQANTGLDVDISRINLGGGWFITKNVLAKVEYVTQSYDGFAPGTTFHDGQFNGVMLEAVISF